MSSPSQRVRRLGTVLLLGAAGLGVSAADTSVATEAASPARVAPACRPAQLTTWQGIPGDGAAGSVYYELQFANTSGTTCSLLGYPGVTAVDSAGRRLGSPATWEPGFARERVVLAPHATAHAVMRLTDVSVFPPGSCSPVVAAGLSILPPNTSRATVIPEPLRVCSAGGLPYLSVRPVRAGVGIPGSGQ